MKRIPKSYYIAAALLLAWAAVNFYDYAAIGTSLAAHYGGEDIILKLVNGVLLEGIVKVLASAAVLAIGFFSAKRK